VSFLLQDIRYALRRFRQSPGFVLICVVTLALGIGANTAIFTLVDAVMFKSLPVAAPAELFRLGNRDDCCVNGGYEGEWSLFSYDQYRHFRDNTPEFSQLAAFQAGNMSISVRRSGASGPADPYAGEFVSGNYFSMFGVSAAAGRVLAPGDDMTGAAPVAVMSYRAWQMHFGKDPSVIGDTLAIEGTSYMIAGVAPPDFFGDRLRPDPPDLWLPLATEPVMLSGGTILNQASTHWLYSIGRLKPGAKPSQVGQEMTVELQQWLAAQPDLTDGNRGELPRQRILLAAAGGGVENLQTETSAGLRLLMAISLLVLLIACANIANLLLARGTASQFETAVRMALGAPRRRLIRQMLTESVMLAFVGGAAGLAVAYVGTRTILLLAFRGSHFVPISATPSAPVLGFALALSVLTGIVFGVAPAWMMSRSDAAEALRGAGRATQDRSGYAQKSLVVVQVALSAILLIGAGLLTQSLRNLQNQQFGFQTAGRLMVAVDMPPHSEESLYPIYSKLEARLPALSGVKSASFALYSPMEGNNWGSGIHIEGRPPDDHASTSWDRVSPHYFETIGTRLLRGRVIGDEDTPTSPRVAVINQTFAKKYFPDGDGIGKHFGFADPTHSGDYEIVGIVEDAKYNNARVPAYSTAFLPLLQMVKFNDPVENTVQLRSNLIGNVELRVEGAPPDLASEIRETLAAIDPAITVLGIQTLDEQVALNFNQDRLVARLTELFGLLALVLACVGLYGLTSYSVTRRTREIGIRMALGATTGNILAQVLRGALLELGIGLAIGVVAALGGGRLMSSQLYGVKSYDPVVIGVAAAILTLCAIAAGLVPARRASTIEPSRALRSE
jgi:predicted permease